MVSFQNLGKIGELCLKDELRSFLLPTDRNSQFRMPLDVVCHVMIDLTMYSSSSLFLLELLQRTCLKQAVHCTFISSILSAEIGFSP